MKKMILLMLTLTFAALLATACSGQNILSPAASEPPVEATAEPTATATAEPTATATAEPAA